MIVVGTALLLLIGMCMEESQPSLSNAPDPGQEASSADQERTIRAHADSLLAAISASEVTSLSDRDARVALRWGDSAKAPALFVALRRDAGRRQAVAQREADRERIERLQQETRTYTFSDGSQCRQGASARIQRLVGEHPEWSDGDLTGIACRAVWIGMTAAQLRASWGSPLRVNRTVTTRFTREQWVYDGSRVYVYLMDGIVTSWQD